LPQYNYHQCAGQSGPQQTKWKQHSKCGGTKNKKKTKPAGGKGKARAHFVDGESVFDSDDQLFGTMAFAEISQGNPTVSILFNVIPSINNVANAAVKKTTPRMTPGRSGMACPKPSSLREKNFHRMVADEVPDQPDALLGVLSFSPDFKVPEGYEMSLPSGWFADYKPQTVGFADYSRESVPGGTSTCLTWVPPVGPFPPLGTPGPVVPSSKDKSHPPVQATDKHINASRVPGASVIEIGSHSAITKRTIAPSAQIQKKPTPPSIYLCVRKAWQIKDRLDLVGTTQVIKNLELNSMEIVEEEEMAP
jgi:hypothetical protein